MVVIRMPNHVISNHGPCYLIAEIGNNHGGSLEVALEMIRQAAACGVQAVKFQKRHNREVFTRRMYDQPYEGSNSFGDTYGAHREFLELGRADYVSLMKESERCGVDFLCTPFDLKSAEFLRELNVPAYKISSFDVKNLPFIRYVASFGKPMFISTGGSTMDDIREVYREVVGTGTPLCLLHCVSAYPAPEDSLELRTISRFCAEFPQALVGYSGHDDGTAAALLAYAMGASVVEKHFTLDRQARGSDHRFSLDPTRMKMQAHQLAQASAMLGTGARTRMVIEERAISRLGKGLYAARPLAAGSRVTEKDICIRSPEAHLTPNKLDQVLGRRLRRALRTEEPVRLEDLVEGQTTGQASRPRSRRLRRTSLVSQKGRSP